MALNFSKGTSIISLGFMLDISSSFRYIPEFIPETSHLWHLVCRLVCMVYCCCCWRTTEEDHNEEAGKCWSQTSLTLLLTRADVGIIAGHLKKKMKSR